MCSSDLVMTHGEKAAAYMADGYARASRKPGVCFAQHVGGSNLAAGLKDAYLACSPVIAITGGPAPLARHRHAYQELEDYTQFEHTTKFNAHVDSVDRIPDLMRQAFRLHPRANAGLTDQLDRLGFQQPRAKTTFDMAPLLPFQHQTIDAMTAQ